VVSSTILLHVHSIIYHFRLWEKECLYNFNCANSNLIYYIMWTLKFSHHTNWLFELWSTYELWQFTTNVSPANHQINDSSKTYTNPIYTGDLYEYITFFVWYIGLLTDKTKKLSLNIEQWIIFIFSMVVFHYQTLKRVHEVVVGFKWVAVKMIYLLLYLIAFRTISLSPLESLTLI